MNKKITLILIICTVLLSMSFVMMGHAAVVYTHTSYFTANLRMPTDVTAFSTSAIAGNGESLTTLQLYLKTGTDSPTGHVVACLWNNTAGYPLLAQTTPYDVSALNTTIRWVTFTFSVPADSLMNTGCTYFVGLNTTGDLTDNLYFGLEETGVHNDFYSGAWNLGDSRALMAIATTGSTPVTTPDTWTPGNSDSTINTLTAILPPLAIFMIPALLLGYIGKWNLWLIMIGLTIGAGLCVLFLGPAYIWLVFSVIIGIVALAWRGHAP